MSRGSCSANRSPTCGDDHGRRVLSTCDKDMQTRKCDELQTHTSDGIGGRMKITTSFTREVNEVPTSCNICPFVNACSQFMYGITKKNGYEFTNMAMRRRHKECRLTVEEN